MGENQGLEALAQAGLYIESAATSGGATISWRDSLQLLAALDAVGRDGATVVVKIDGGRSGNKVYTVVVSGGRLREEFFHKDGAELLPLLREAVAFYAAHARSGAESGR